MDETTEMGPMANRAQYNKVLEYFDVVKEDGATCILGGKASDKGGLFINPTIYINVKNDMRIAQEEVFGPVLSVIKFSDEEEVVKLANDITYGLASGIWTTSMQRAIRVSNQIQAGTVWINTYRAVSTLAPYGGYKDSGIGRENGEESLNEYLQTKTIWLSTAEEIPNSFIMKV
ncbi:hypothetical protein CDV26_09975 [Francisella halioticida]|uniref:Aldehyde dehydrogenase domain-containing protein n=1 Tax=Francisella halioticida TaxID=549298 RepID=A0ABN5B0U5_9GAMM|nr:hypothetical protein CDV26_09975 [Francisella halioticida]